MIESRPDLCVTRRGWRVSGHRVVKLLALVAVLAIAGCASPDRRTAPAQSARHLPHAVFVDDGKGGKVLLRLSALADGGRFTSGFGWRGASGGTGGPHRGIDIAAPVGTPVRASAAGVVTAMTRHRGYGRLIRIRHADHLETAYAHLSRFAPRLAVGQPVKQGEIIGYVGTSGRTTGPHLHFELRRHGRAVDPLGFPVAGAGH